MTNIVTTIELDELKKRWQKRVKDYLRERNYAWEDLIEYTMGKKYARFTSTDHGQTSAREFIDLSNGDILMAAAWAKPAKHARGNIYSDQHGMEAIDRTGFVKYLR